MDIKDLEKFKDISVKPEDLDGLAEDDKEHVLINVGMMYLNALNTIENTIHEMQNMTRMIIPEPVEKIKILLSRIEDLDPSKMEELSLGFIKQVFTIDGKELKVTMPEVGEIDDLKFYRLVLMQLKEADEQAATALKIYKQILDKFKSDIPDNIKALLGNVEKMDEWMISYINRKLESETLSDEEKHTYRRRLQAYDDSYTLAPIINQIKEQIAKSGKDSILHYFVTKSDAILSTAVNVCHKAGIEYPFQMFNDIEDKLLGDKKPVKSQNLFTFLLSRYIRYKKDSFDDYDRIFITNLCAHLVILKRVDTYDKIPKLYNKMKGSMLELLSLFASKTA